jgi:hypothetical protein
MILQQIPVRNEGHKEHASNTVQLELWTFAIRTSSGLLGTQMQTHVPLPFLTTPCQVSLEPTLAGALLLRASMYLICKVLDDKGRV